MRIWSNQRAHANVGIMKVPPLVRWFTDPLLSELRVPIVGGVNRGQWWSLMSAGSGYASGRRANSQMQLLADLMRPADVVWDVGAHHGYVALCAARIIGTAGSVHAFEPSAMNRTRLARHVRWNHLPNVTVHPFALSRFNGESTFGGTGTSKMFALGGGTQTVQVRTAAALVEQGVCPAPTFVKIDVEGAEADTLHGMIDILPLQARLIVAMHGREVDQRCTDMLENRGWTCTPSHDLARSRAGAWDGDPDLFCTGPTYDGSSADRATLRRTNF